MRDEYDFSQSVHNPYLKRLKKQVSISLDDNVCRGIFSKVIRADGNPLSKSY
jgi:hypothetical protein